MENKIQELTDKIYREGVEKGNEEAQRLIGEAQKEAQKLLEEARKQADSIVADAQKKADELTDNTKSELKLFGGQAVNALKEETSISTIQVSLLISDGLSTYMSALSLSISVVGSRRTLRSLYSVIVNVRASEGVIKSSRNDFANSTAASSG